MKSNRVYLSVDQRSFDGALQISINVEDEKGGGYGYRIAGPKYDGSGRNLIKKYLDERDAAEIKQHLANIPRVKARGE